MTKPCEAPLFEGQSVADKLDHIRDEIEDLLEDLEGAEVELVDAARGCSTPYWSVKARHDAIIDAIDTLQLLLFREDPPAFLCRSVK